MNGGIDALVDAWVRPLADALASVVFFEVTLAGTGLPLVVLWLAFAAGFFTLRFRFVNLRGFGHALELVRGRVSRSDAPGEVSHFQALATAISGTVGIGNIGGVAVAISVGGPGAAFWMVLAGFLGMSTKFVECTLGVMYRREHPDGSVSGGPMHYLERGLAERGWPRLGRGLGVFYALGIVIGCLGIGNMFQSNQAFAQIVGVSGGDASWLADKGWLVGTALAALVAIVILGGVRSIARVAATIVPFMGALYLLGALAVLALAPGAIGPALAAIVQGAWGGDALAGGALGALVTGFRRAVFSNEAGIGSATIAHSAVRTSEPLTEGYVALLEPFIDTVVICNATALVVVTALVADPSLASAHSGIELTSAAFESRIPWAALPLALAATLFAFSTMLAWSYYGLKGFTYLVGEQPRARQAFNAVFCGFVVLGAMIELDAVLDFSDALVFLICVPNLLGLYVLAPRVARRLRDYEAGRRR